MSASTVSPIGALILGIGGLGFLGMMAGYYGIKKDLDGAVFGFIIAIILCYFGRDFLLGFLTSL